MTRRPMTHDQANVDVPRFRRAWMRPGHLWAIVALLLIAIPADAATDDDDAAQAPREPGFHYLNYEAEVGGKKRRMNYGAYLPPQVEQADAKLPMVVFLHGIGERGEHERQLYLTGPLGDIRRSKLLREKVDFILLAPHCPRDKRWESQEMASFVSQTVKRAIEQWPVDPRRVYLTGLSMGGAGTWWAVRDEPDLYAAIAPMCARAVEPEDTAQKLGGVTVWIIVGGGDAERFRDGSRQMHAALDEAGVDATLTVVPGVGHGVWPMYYRKPQFYDWLKHHRKGEATPGRPGPDAMLAYALLPPADAKQEKWEKRLAYEFAQFRPFWQIDNCRRTKATGLHPKLRGRQSVFITHPIHAKVPCRLMTTYGVPARGRSHLELHVGHEKGGAWDLQVRLNNEQVLNQTIGGQGDDQGDRRAAGDPQWQTVTVDLGKYRGQQVDIEVYHLPRGEGGQHAYWDRINVVTR